MKLRWHANNKDFNVELVKPPVGPNNRTIFHRLHTVA